MDAKAKVKRGELFSTLSMPVLLVILIVFFSIMSPRFLSPLNLTNILVQNVHVAIVAAVIVYIIALFALRAVTAEDISMLPKGRKIAKVLEKYKLIG